MAAQALDKTGELAEKIADKVHGLSDKVGK